MFCGVFLQAIYLYLYLNPKYNKCYKNVTLLLTITTTTIATASIIFINYFMVKIIDAYKNMLWS